MASTDRIVAFTWHQRTSPIDARERLLGKLASGGDRVLLATCHRVELYAAVPLETDPLRSLDGLDLAEADRAAMVVRADAAAIAHLFAVAAGLDSAVVGEPQILAQVRRACLAPRHPLLVAALGSALHVGRSVRAVSGLSTNRSVGSLAVDAALSGLASPSDATILVIGAGEMGKLALRALALRVASVVIANRDEARADALAQSHGGRAVRLDDVPSWLARADAVISAADTRGAVLTPSVIARRLSLGPLAVIDIAVPRSVDRDARARLGDSYRSVDDLPGAAVRIPDAALAAAREACAREAERFLMARQPERTAAIRDLRASAERVRAEKLARAMKRLGHLSPRDRRIVEALSTTITNALLHEPTVSLRERGESDGHAPLVRVAR